MKNALITVQAVIQFLVGTGAAISGAMLVAVPSGALLQAQPDMLKGSPFPDFLIPGSILFLVNGAGQIVAGVLTVRKHPCAAYVGAVFGLGLIIWIFVQVNMIGGGHILQYSYFAAGVVEVVLSFLIQDRASPTGEHRGEVRMDTDGI